MGFVETVRFIVRKQTLLGCVETVRFIVRTQTPKGLCRYCKVYFEDTNS
jgi:hypothetical protein